jgi:hypothetical protein
MTTLLSKIKKQKIQNMKNDNPLDILINFLKNLRETDNIKSKLTEFRKSTKHPLSLSVINYMLSQDSSNSILVLQSKEFAARIEKNNEIKTKELFDDIPNCDKNTILDFFNNIVKLDIRNVRDTISGFLLISDCKFDNEIINIFNYIADQSDEDLNVIIHSFIKRNKVLAKNRPSIKEYYNTYLTNLDNFIKEKITTQMYFATNKKEKERLQKELKQLLSSKKDKKKGHNYYYKKVIISKMSRTDLKFNKNDNYYVQNLNSIPEEYKSTVKIIKQNENYIETLSKKIAELQEKVDYNKNEVNDIKQTIERIERGEKIQKSYEYNPTSPVNTPSPKYMTVKDKEKELEYYTIEFEKYNNELQKSSKELKIVKNSQNILKKNLPELKSEYAKVNNLRNKGEAVLKNLKNKIEENKRIIKMLKKDNDDKLLERINQLTEEIDTTNNNIEIVDKVLHRKLIKNIINYDIEIDVNEIQNEILNLYNENVSIDLINQLYDEIQDSRAKNEDDNNRFLEILDDMKDVVVSENISEYEIGSEEYKGSGYIDSESQEFVDSQENQQYYEQEEPKKKEKKIYVKNPVTEFTKEEKKEYEEFLKKQEENEEIIKTLIDKSDTELINMSDEYSIELPLDLKEIIERKPTFIGEKNRNSLIDLIIRHLRNITKKNNKFFGLYNNKEEERLKLKKEQDKIKLYDENENFIEFLKKIKSIDNEIELQNEVNMFFEKIDDKKIEEILTLMIRNYDIKTFSEFLRWFFEQKNNKESYTFIQYYNKFGYIIDEEKDEKEESDEENEEEGEDVIENLFDKDLSELRNIYEKKKKIAKKINVVFNVKMDNMTVNKMIKIIDALNQLIHEKKEAIKLEETNYMAFNDHLKLRNFLVGLNLNDENDVMKQINEIMKSKFTAVLKNEKIYKSSEYFNMFKEILETLSVSSMIEMIRGYLNQYKMTFMEYFALFSKEHEKLSDKIVLDKIRPYSLVCDYMIEQNICGEEFSSYEELEKHIKEIHMENKTEEEISEEMNTVYNGKLFNYINRPWIKYNIKKTYISEVPDKTCILNFNMYVKNIKVNKPIKFIDMEGNEWYQVNKHFFDIEVDDSISKNQEGEILSFYGNKGIYKDKCLLKIKLGFKTVSSKGDDFIIQDEKIYRDEQDYLNNISAELNEFTVNELLDKPLNSDSNAIRIGTSYISKVFDIIGTSYTYKDIFKNVDYENLTVRKYASYIFSICSYLNSEIFDNIFRKRMKKQYYNPEKILNLTMFDKIPELLCNDNNFNDQVIKYMTYKINKDIYQFGENLFISSRYTKTEYERMYFDDERMFIIPNKYNSLNKICQEFGSEIEDVEIFKDENEDEYCLNIKDLLKHIYNNEEFDYFPNISMEFFERIQKIYKKDIIYEKEKEVEKKEYKLVYLIITDILDRTKDKYNFSQLNKMFLFDVKDEKDNIDEINKIFENIEDDDEEEEEEEEDEEDAEED